METDLQVCLLFSEGNYKISVECDGKPIINSPWIAKAYNAAAIKVQSVPAVRTVGTPVEFTGILLFYFHLYFILQNDLRSEMIVSLLHQVLLNEFKFCFGQLFRALKRILTLFRR